MIVTPIKTSRITPPHTPSLAVFIKQHIQRLPERSVLAVTSKVVSLCEGRVVPIAATEKQALIQQEADWYLPPEQNRYHISLAITKHILAASAGIDESNTNGYYVLWPKDPFRSARMLWRILKAHTGVKELGIIITDSKTSPLRWGVTAQSIAWCGINPLRSYIGKQDLFGRAFRMTQVSVIDSLATAAALVMGEGSEQQPLSVITDIPNIRFVSRPPQKSERDKLNIDPEADVYHPLLLHAGWLAGGGGYVRECIP